MSCAERTAATDPPHTQQRHTRVFKVPKVLKVSKDPKVFKVFKVPKDLKVPKVSKVFKDLKDLRDLTPSFKKRYMVFNFEVDATSKLNTILNKLRSM